MISKEDVRVIMILYTRWRGMNKRCLRPRYIEKSVYVDQEWSGLRGFENFAVWSLSNGFKANLVIDRRDNNGPYSPDNCHWVTNSQNLRNTMNSRSVEYLGTYYNLKTLSEHADCVVPYYLLKSRVNAGWSIEEAVTRETNHGNGWVRGIRQKIRAN